jgi:hypothetical protein
MASSDLDLSDYRKFGPPYDEPPRQRGCFFYGCIIAGILALLLLIALGVGFFFVYRLFEGLVEQYTATAPRELPKVEMSVEQRRTLRERVDAFRADIKEGRTTAPLVLSSEDLNALIEENPDLKGRVYVTIDQDKLKGQVSIPLDRFPSFGLTRGRYLNGEGEFKVSLEDGVLIVTLESLLVNGKTLPPELMDSLRNQNLARDAYKDEKNAEEIRKFESITIKDGKLVIKARARTKAPEGGKSEGSPEIETRDGKVIVHPPEKAAPSGGTSTPSKALPENVLAPAESSPASTAEPAKSNRP